MAPSADGGRRSKPAWSCSNECRRQTPRAHEIIIISAYEHLARTPQQRQLLEAWQQALRQALRRGWQVTILWHRDRRPDWAEQIALRLLGLVGMPGFEPRYFVRAQHCQPPTNGLIIPGYAGYFNLCAENLAAPDAAIVVRDKRILETLYCHFSQLKTLTQPLAQPLARAAAAGGDGAHWEDTTGGRWLVAGDVRLCGLPRDAPLDRGMEEHPCYEIRTMRAFTTLLRADRALSHGVTEADLHRAPPARGEHVERVRQLIHLLETQANYQLALADEDEAQTFQIADQTRWMATGDGRAIVTAMSPPDADPQAREAWTDYLIAEPCIGAAFQRRFLSIWQRLAPAHREKEQVIAWLEAQLDHCDEPRERS